MTVEYTEFRKKNKNVKAKTKIRPLKMVGGEEGLA